MNVVKRLFKIQNLNASTIRTVMVADCSRFDSPDLLLDADAPGAAPSRVFDLGGSSDDGEDEAASPGPARTKGLRRLLDGLLEGQAQPPLSERALETKVAELLAQGRTKPPERGSAFVGNKLLVFTTGCLTYSPHQIGKGPEARLPGAGQSPWVAGSRRWSWGPRASPAPGRAGRQLPGTRCRPRAAGSPSPAVPQASSRSCRTR